jgi:hypothetical protein
MGLIRQENPLLAAPIGSRWFPVIWRLDGKPLFCGFKTDELPIVFEDDSWRVSSLQSHLIGILNMSQPVANVRVPKDIMGP